KKSIAGWSTRSSRAAWSRPRSSARSRSSASRRRRSRATLPSRPPSKSASRSSRAPEMTTLVLADREALRAALDSGLIPAEVQAAPLQADVGDDGELLLDPQVEISRADR